MDWPCWINTEVYNNIKKGEEEDDEKGKMKRRW